MEPTRDEFVVTARVDSSFKQSFCFYFFVRTLPFWPPGFSSVPSPPFFLSLLLLLICVHIYHITQMAKLIQEKIEMEKVRVF